MSVSTISPAEVADALRSGPGAELIDVRTPVEFRGLHAIPARNVPLDRLETIAEGDRTRRLYVICQSGARGAKARDELASRGFTNVINVEGGTLAWEKAGLPVVRGKKAISLERQVRIAAGSLVLLGVVLSWLVHPYWIGISAFVGAGLVFAGVTDTCGMALILARMPWNQIRDESSSDAAACRL